MPHKLHTIQVHVDGSSAVNLPDIASNTIENNPELEGIVTAGEISPTFVAMLAQQFQQTFESFAIPSILDEIGLTGICIKSSTNPGVTAYLQQFDSCGDPVAGANHRSFNVKSGFIFPQSLTVDHRGHARLTVGIAIVKVDGSDVIVVSDIATLPAVTITSARWSLGDMQIAGYAITDDINLQIDFGNRVEMRGVSSEIYDKYIEMRTGEPMVTIRGIKADWFASANIPIGGKSATHANSFIYLRKRAEGNDGYVADATTQHIKFTLDGLAVMNRILAGDDPQRFTEHELVVKCKKDASGNAPLTYDGAIAHPT